ncbi:unnamed protein product [Meloidogyne enterolobii]|uniref:Uncharacterized protein n=1 Tax=Meloidogyne enterolobii TaxID=390850 RepID=A0ACB1AG17_MELEN
MNVTLVNALSEQYLQGRIVSIDRRWMSQLRFYLGTEFDKLYFDNEMKGEISAENIRGVLMERLKNLSNHITNKEGKKPKSFLNLIYETADLDIDTKHEKPLAILSAPLKRQKSFDLHSLKEILTNYQGMKIFESNKIAIPFDLFFFDFTKFKYDIVIINKKNHNEKIFKNENQNMSIKTKLMNESLFFSLEGLFKKSYFLSEGIKNRYHGIKKLIIFGMKEVKHNSQIALRTGKVNETKEGRLFGSKGDVISVQISEREKTIQIDSELPVAIVELIEEVKNEMEKVKKMNVEEVKKKWEEAVIAKGKLNHEQNKKIKEANNGWSEKEENLKKWIINEFKSPSFSIEDEREKILNKYKYFIVDLKEEWFRALFYHVFKEVYKNGEKKKVIIKLSTEKMEEKEKEKGEASTSKQDEHILYFDQHSLVSSVLQIYGKENEKDSAILVNMDEENTNKSKFIEDKCGSISLVAGQFTASTRYRRPITSFKIVESGTPWSSKCTQP